MASSRMRGFRWLSANLGLPFPVDAAAVRDFVQAPSGHVPKQALSLSPGDFVNTMALALQEESTSNIPAKLVVLACTVCIRCKHFARSQMQRITDTMLTAHCAKGKKVSKGARPPYTWALPILPCMGDDFFKFLADLLHRWQHPPYLVPAFQAGTTRRKFMARGWQQKPMLVHQWVSLLKQVATATGWCVDDLGALSYNSMRRILPTMTNVLGFPDNVAQAVGSWQEIPQGEGTSGKASQRMSLHYSDEKALASCEAKREVLDLFMHLIQGHKSAMAALSGKGTYLQKDAFSWEDLARLHRDQAAAAQGHPPSHPYIVSHTTTAPPKPHLTPQPSPEARKAKKAKKAKKEDKQKGRSSKKAHKDARPDGPKGKRSRPSP